MTRDLQVVVVAVVRLTECVTRDLQVVVVAVVRLTECD